MIRIGSMPTFVQKSSSPPSTTSSPAAGRSRRLRRLGGLGLASSTVSGSASTTSSSTGSASSAAAASDSDAVHVGGADDLVDGAEHVVPAAPDDVGDRVPALEPGLAGEVVDAAAQRAQRRVAVEELHHRRQLAHRPDRRDDRQRIGQRGHRLRGRLVRHHVFDSDQVEVFVVARGPACGRWPRSALATPDGRRGRCRCWCARMRPDRRVSRRCRGLRPCPGTPPTRRRRRASEAPTRCSGRRRSGSSG